MTATMERIYRRTRGSNVILVTVFLTSIFSETSSAAKILFVPCQFRSHVLEELVLAEELVTRGHNVHMTVSSRYPKPEKVEKLGIKTVSFQVPDDVIVGMSDEGEREFGRVMFSPLPHEEKMELEMKFATDIVYADCSFMMRDTAFLERLRNISFDLAVVDAFVVAPCNTILARYLEVPFVSMTGMFIPWHIRIPALPSFVTLPGPYPTPERLSFLERLGNFIGFLVIQSDLIFPVNTTLLERYSEHKSWDELMRKSELFISSRDHHLGSFLPTMPNFVIVPGLTTNPAKPLSPELEKLVVENPNGIILVTFGSTAHYFPAEIVRKFFKSFDGLNQTVIAKFAVPDGMTVPKNVKILDWLPQNDLLGHRQTRLFITHGGNNGQYEALYHGVPMIGFPLFAEQTSNCHRAYTMELALEMDIHTFTSADLRSAIDKVLSNPLYRNNIKRMSEIWKDQPMTPREKAVYWIEHVAKYGGQHLRSAAMDMTFSQFLMLDILALVFLVLLVLVLMFTYVARWCFRRCCRSRLKFKLN